MRLEVEELQVVAHLLQILEMVVIPLIQVLQPLMEPHTPVTLAS
jgi:hypothetical protein